MATSPCGCARPRGAVTDGGATASVTAGGDAAPVVVSAPLRCGAVVLKTRHTEALRTNASTPKTSQASADVPVQGDHAARQQAARDDAAHRARRTSHRRAPPGRASASCVRHQPEQNTNTIELATPARKRSAGHSDAYGTAIASVRTVVPARPMRTSVGPSIGGTCGQARPDQRHEGAQERAGEVAEVVRARQPARAVQVDDAVVQHHRQQRRESEAADSHRDGERHHPRGGDGEGARSSVGRRGRQRFSSTISTQFGLRPTSWLAISASLPLASSIA